MYAASQMQKAHESDSVLFDKRDLFEYKGKTCYIGNSGNLKRCEASKSRRYFRPADRFRLCCWKGWNWNGEVCVRIVDQNRYAAVEPVRDGAESRRVYPRASQ